MTAEQAERFRERGRERELVVGDAGVGVNGSRAEDPDFERLASGSRDSEGGRARFDCITRDDDEAPGVVGVGGADEEASTGGGIEIIWADKGMDGCGGPLALAWDPPVTFRVVPFPAALFWGGGRTFALTLGRGFGVGGSDRGDNRGVNG